MLKPDFIEADHTLNPKVVFLNSVFLFAGIVAFGMGFFRWQTQASAVMGSIDFVFSLCNFALVYYLNSHKEHVETISSIALVLSYCLFTAIYLLAPYNTTRISLFFLLSASSFFLKGRLSGLTWLILILLTIVIGHFLPGFDTAYSHIDIVTASLYLLALFFIFFNYEIFKEKVNERDREKEVLRLSEERFRTMVENGNDIISIISNTGTVRFISPSIESVLGFAPGEIINKNVNDLVHPDEQQKIVTALTNALAHPGGETLEQYEFRMKHKDGSYRDIEMVVRNLINNPVIGGIVLNGRDITERKLAIIALQESERDLNRAQAIAHVGSWIYDLATSQITWSDELYRIYGVSPETFTPSVETLINLIHPDEQSAMKEWMDACASGHKAGALEFRCVWPDGTIHYISSQGELFFDAKGKPSYMSGTAQDITVSKAVEEQIKYIAFYDPLTRLPNRRLLMDRLHQALASSARVGREGALLFIDLDNFKSINDTLGHDIGDLLLQQVAQRLTSCVRDNDTVSRLGGDEFVLVLENLSAQPIEAAAQTKTIGNKILAALIQPYQLATYEYRGSASIGATLFNGNTLATDELMKQADIAMYQSKKAGRNTLRFFDQKMQASVTGRFSLEGELRKALGNQEFHLYYQIQVDNSFHPLGAEALIRWLHPLRGMILPAQFIPLAETTGLILTIGHWVLETACAQIKTWQQDALTRDLVASVNISAKQFRQTDFVSQVQALVQHHAINPRLLKLELTESLLLEDIEDTIVTMNALNEIGIRFSLDDFGTGYSSLQYLKRLPLDQLKIDQSFVRDIATDNSDKMIVKTIIAMAHSLNLDVIAEGVETEAQWQFLIDEGCTHFQGYLFGKPVPIAQFEALLKHG